MHLKGGVEHLRRVAPDPVDVGTELCVLDAVHFYHICRGLVHTVVLVCQFVPCRLQRLAMATPGHDSDRYRDISYCGSSK